MISLIKSKRHILYFVIFLISIFPILTRTVYRVDSVDTQNQNFNKDLKRLNTINKLIKYTDSLYSENIIEKFDTASYISLIDKVIQERFYHGQLNYNFAENWISYLLGKFTWSHFSAVVIPNDLLKHTEALCSQQTIIFMEILRKKSINVRSVGLGYAEGPGHFLCETQYAGGWHLYDVSIEPDWAKIGNQHLSLDYYLKNKDSLYVAYESKLPKNVFFKLLEKHSYGKINQMPARNMRIFHWITKFLTFLIPGFFLFFFNE